MADDVVTEDPYDTLKALIEDETKYEVDASAEWYNTTKKGTQLHLKEVETHDQEIDDSRKNYRDIVHFDLHIIAESRSYRNEAYKTLKNLFRNRSKTVPPSSASITSTDISWVRLAGSFNVGEMRAVMPTIDKEKGRQGEYYQKILYLDVGYREIYD